MLTIKNRFHLIIVFCFLAASFSFHSLWAEETSKETTSDVKEIKGKHEKASAQNYPQISFDSTQYDAGEVYEGDVIVHGFVVKNTGTAQLNIEKVKPG
jgi:hypothetical protein